MAPAGEINETELKGLQGNAESGPRGRCGFSQRPLAPPGMRGGRFGLEDGTRAVIPPPGLSESRREFCEGNRADPTEARANGVAPMTRIVLNGGESLAVIVDRTCPGAS